MSYGRGTYGASAYGGAVEVQGADGGAAGTDPANPEGSGWRWSTRTALGPYAALAYGGAGAIGYPSSGGISATPDPLMGVVRLTAWWSRAPYLRVVRVAGGERTEVRGAYPISVTTPTRRNYCTNPSFEVSLAGWLAGTNTTMARITGTIPDGTAAARLTATAAGAVNATVPVALSLVNGQPQVSLALRLSAQPTGDLTVSVQWIEAAGVVRGTTTATIPSATLAKHVGRWDRTAVLSVPPPPPGGMDSTDVVGGTMTMSIGGLGAGDTADLDAVLIESGTSSGEFFDGDAVYAAWQGTPNASESVLAPVVQFVDREAPLDVPVQYELSAPDQAGYVAISEPVVLDSRDGTWLGHPVLGNPVPVTVLEEPEVSRAMERGVHKVIGRRRPVAISAAQRSSSEGTLEVLVVTFADRERVWALLDDGQPLLLRAPARLGHGLGEWVSVGDVTLTRPGHGAWEDARVFKLPYSVVDAPPANPDDPSLAVVA